MSVRPLLGVVVLVGSVAVVGLGLSCGTPDGDEVVPEPATADQIGEQWTVFHGEFLKAYLEAQPHLAVARGRHEFDGLFPDWSRDGLSRWEDWLRRTRAAAVEFPERNLGQAAIFELHHLIAGIDADLFLLEELGRPGGHPLFYAPALDPSVYLVRPYAPLEQRMESFAKLAEGVPEVVARVRGNLAGPLAPVRAEAGLRAYRRTIELFRDGAPQAFGRVADSELQERLRIANSAAVSALSGLVVDLQEHLGGEGGNGFALGEDRLRRMLWVNERLEVGLGEIAAVGAQDLARTTTALAVACETLLDEPELASCIGRARSQAVEFDPVITVQSNLSELRRRLDQAGLVSVPASAGVRVGEGVESRYGFVESVDLPGPFENDGVLATYSIAGVEPAAELGEPGAIEAHRPSRADLLLASAASIWPGRYLRSLHANRRGLPVAGVFVGRGLADGWAHYARDLAVERIWDEEDAAIDVGHLTGLLLEGSRLVVVIGLHTGEMNLEQATQFFMERAFLDEKRARQEAVDCAADPTRMSAALGRLLLLRLREDWSAVRGGRGDLAEFHDRLLSFGAPPLMMLREAMVPEVQGSAF